MSLTTYDSRLPRTTEFPDDAIAIDPPACGCVDCLVGAAITLDSPLRLDLAMEHFHPAIRRPIINRSGHNLFAMSAMRAVRDLKFSEYDMRRDFAFDLVDRFPMDLRATIEQIRTH